MKRITKKIVKKSGKEALNITTRAVSGDIFDIAKESIKDELERSGVTDVFKETQNKKSKKVVERGKKL